MPDAKFPELVCVWNAHVNTRACVSRQFMQVWVVVLVAYVHTVTAERSLEADRFIDR